MSHHAELVKRWHEARYRGGNETVANLGVLGDYICIGDAMADALAAPAFDRERLARALEKSHLQAWHGAGRDYWLSGADAVLAAMEEPCE